MLLTQRYATVVLDCQPHSNVWLLDECQAVASFQTSHQLLLLILQLTHWRSRSKTPSQTWINSLLMETNKKLLS